MAEEVIRARWLGHAAVELWSSKKTLLFDPYITDNPLAPVKPNELKADYILISHAHFDHLGDTEAIARASNALVISTAEVVRLCESKGLRTHAMHIGGKRSFDFGYIRVTPAFHGAGIEGGHACGFVVQFYGKRIYFAGDTGLFSDMKLIGELEPLDLAFLPIGGNFTMGVEDAVIATEYLKPKAIVPVHYNTWPLIEADPYDFQKKVEARVGARVVVLRPGEVFEF
ncbi:MAG: metal-dependent hydrolase [Thermanaeromonas sp.]|uniref:metal-dependent hydrolase n=1 Tax=Thermanaeromonas sp. TaxID=2003697 RepID=UPI002440052F|nr:metal-dependent hydrolase [Thermanaeromonas sp.]MCG0277805.1 metal-dependent hydrolase [Thermanaeromonas sp.]